MENFRQIRELESLIKEHEEKYRNGNPEVDDNVFDSWVEQLRQLDPNSELVNRITGEKVFGEKTRLPKPMGSLEKIKSEKDLLKWVNKESEYVIMPKYDGISMYNEIFYNQSRDEISISRGDDGLNGTIITDTFKKTMRNFNNKHAVRGELVISRKNFEIVREICFKDDNITNYKTERSAIVAQFRSHEPNEEILKLIEFKPFEIYDLRLDKRQMLEEISSNDSSLTLFKHCVGSEINHEFLTRLFNEWSKDYEIDGLVIDINCYETRDEIGFETNSFNPKYAKAYKNGFEEEKETTILEIKRQINKSGETTPVAIIESVELCGNTVSKINLDNERFLLYYGIGAGSEITVKKSGNVIPRMTRVGDMKILNAKEFLMQIHYSTLEQFQEEHKIINNYSKPNFEYEWDRNFVNIRTKSETNEQRKRRILFFFKTMRILSIGESAINDLFSNGYNSIEKIINMDFSELKKLNGWGDKKINNLKEELFSKLGLASIELLMHSSGYFDKIGETKLSLLGLSHENFVKTENEISKISGVGDFMVNSYISNINLFKEFYDKISDKIIKKENDGKLKGKIFCFTGFRDSSLVDRIIENGGDYKDSLTKIVTILVHNGDRNTVKIKKAEESGIEIYDRNDLENLLNKINFTSDINSTNKAFNSLL